MDKFLKFETEERIRYIALRHISDIIFYGNNSCSIWIMPDIENGLTCTDLIPNAEKAFFDFITNAYGFGEGSDVLILKKMPEVKK